MTVQLKVDRLRANDIDLHWLAGFNIRVKDQTLNLYGPNGCGKSTILRVLVGELAAEWHFEGNVQVPADIQFINESGSSIFTFRSAIGSLYSHTARRGSGFELALERAKSLLEHTGLPTSLLERDSFTLSSGERKILALACGVAIQPKLLVVDEPAAHIHTNLRQSAIDWLVDTDNGLRSVVISSHEAIGRSSVSNVSLPYLDTTTHPLRSAFTQLMQQLDPSHMHEPSVLTAEENLIVSSHPRLLARPAWRKILETDIAVRSGAVTVLTGKNGTGKTTTLRTIGGLRAPAAGVVRWGGVSVYEKKNKSARARLQNSTAYKLTTPLANAEFVINEAKRVAKRSRTHDVLSQIFNRHDWIERPWTLSAGQQNLLSIFAVLSSSRSNLNLDEPFSHMATDWVSDSFHMLIRAVKATNRTCLLTHHPADGHDITTGNECCVWHL